MVDVLGMVAEPDKIAATDQISELKPRLVGNRQKQRFLGKINEPFEGFFRFKQMFEYFQSHDGVEPAIVELGVEQIGTGEALPGPARTRMAQCVGTQIKPLIGRHGDIALCHHIEYIAFTTTEIEHTGRGKLCQ